MFHFRDFSKYSLLLALISYNDLSSCKISKCSFEWIQRKWCTSFWARYGLKMPYFFVNRSLLSIFTIATFIYLSPPIIMQNLNNIPKLDSESKTYERFLARFVIKMFHLGTNKSILIIFTILNFV